eukprot:3380339-Rhodomonas_salina.1
MTLKRSNQVYTSDRSPPAHRKHEIRIRFPFPGIHHFCHALLKQGAIRSKVEGAEVGSRVKRGRGGRVDGSKREQR